MSADEGSGTEIKGILALVSSANIDDPDLVIAKFTFEKYSATLLLKLKIFSIKQELLVFFICQIKKIFI